MERCIFRHAEADVWIVADAYRGDSMRAALVDFLDAAAGTPDPLQRVERDGQGDLMLPTHGGASLVVFVGHNGLMDFRLEGYPVGSLQRDRSAIVLACLSKPFFTEPLETAGIAPLLWTTGLMAPEAYTLHDAIEGWILNETPEQIRGRAARAYTQYQKCGFKAARNLLVTGLEAQPSR
jgi:hypothetical protein